jgi:hypothetical protein
MPPPRKGLRDEANVERLLGLAAECWVVQLGGLEPPTSCSTDRRSNQLSYNCILAATQKKGGPERAGN